MTPADGGYWFRPALKYLVTSSSRRGAQSKSGKPCDRLIALCSWASRDMTVKIVVPTLGSLEAMALEYSGIVGGRKKNRQYNRAGTGFGLRGRALRQRPALVDE